MNGEKVKQFVSEAFDLPTEQRDAFVRKVCGDDQSLLQEVLSLLDAASNAEDAGFLPSSARAGRADFATAAEQSARASTISSNSPDFDSPEKFGRYKVLERIGEGGMGIVYRAEQRSPMRREVVVKVIKLGMDTKLVIARFEAERQALAMMDHPHIAKVYDAGTDDRGRPYFVMEYVKGTPILDYCDRNHLTVRQRLELFTQVCQAIQHAHHKGIIHRDIKPSNILVSTQDGKPFAKVIDFGIAKATNQRLTDRTLFTEHVNMIGTPAYMSPEQADGNIDIDTRTDVYSLGVVLYELLTGHTPFDAKRLKSAAINEIARIIRDEEPLKPSTLVNTMDARQGQLPSSKKIGSVAGAESGPTLATLAKARGCSAEAYEKSLRGEVDWIVMKALEKDRARRYATPNELAEDVERHLNGLPILAAPPSLLYQATKFARKYRAPVAAGLAIALVLLIAIASVSVLAIKLGYQVSRTQAALVDARTARDQEAQQRKEADIERATAESAAHAAKYEAARNQAQYLISQKLLDQALVAAKEAYRLGGNWQDGLLLSQIVNESRKTWHLEHSIPITEAPICGAMSQTQNGMVVVVAFPSSLAEYDLNTGKLLATAQSTIPIDRLVPFRGPQDQIMAVSSSSVQVLSLNDLTVTAQHDFGSLAIVSADAATSAIALTLSDHTTRVYSDSLALIGSQPWPKSARLNENQPLNKLTISPDGKWVVSSGVTWWDDCLFWNTSTNQTFVTPVQGQAIRFIDNLTLVSASSGFGMGITLFKLTIAPDQSGVRFVWKFLSSSQDGHADIAPYQPAVSSVWLCTLSGDDIGSFPPPIGDANGIYLPGPWGFAAVTFGTTSEAFPDVVTQRYASLLGRNDLTPTPLAIAADGSRFALACKDRLLFFDRASPPINDFTKGHHSALGSTAMYVADPDRTTLSLQIIPADPTRQPLLRRLAMLPAAAPNLRSIVCGIAVSQDQRTVAVRYAQSFRYIVVGQPIQNHSVVIYSGLDPVTARPSNVPPVEIRLLTQDDNADAAAREYHLERILDLSPDGKYLLVGTRVTYESSVAELYRTSDGHLIHYWPPGRLGGDVTSIGNSKWFADAPATGNSIRLISWETGNVEREINVPGKVAGLCGAAAGQALLASIDGKTIAKYDVESGSLLRQIDSDLLPVDSSPDGKVFIGYLPEQESNGSMLLADGQTGNVLAVLSRGTRRNTAAQFASDGQSFMLWNNTDNDSADLVRNLSPDLADRVLDSSGVAAANVEPDQSALEPPAIKVVPVLSAESTAAPTTTIDASDMAKLTASIGSKAIVQGKPTSIVHQPGKTYMIVAFGPTGQCFDVFVVPHAYGELMTRFGGSPADALSQKTLRVTGTIVVYHGLPEIVVQHADQLQIVDSPASAAPGQ